MCQDPANLYNIFVQIRKWHSLAASELSTCSLVEEGNFVQNLHVAWWEKETLCKEMDTPFPAYKQGYSIWCMTWPAKCTLEFIPTHPPASSLGSVHKPNNHMWPAFPSLPPTRPTYPMSKLLLGLSWVSTAPHLCLTWVLAFPPAKSTGSNCLPP